MGWLYTWVGHRPQPGPSYWDWRCMWCGYPVTLRSAHRRVWRWQR